MSDDRSMRMSDVLRVAVSQLRESPVFFYANVTAISVGVLLIIVMLSIAVGVRRYVENTLRKEAAADMIEVSADARIAAAPPLTYAHIAEIARMPAIRFVYPVVQGVFADLATRNGESTFISLASTTGSTDPEVTRYAFLAGNVAALHRDSVVVPESVVRQLAIVDPRAAVGRRVTLRITRAGLHGDESVDLPLTIAAVARETRFSRCYVLLPLAQQIVKWQSNIAAPPPVLAATAIDHTFVFDTIYIYTTDVASVPATRTALERRGYQTASILDSIHRYDQILFAATIVLTSLGAIALFTGSISIFNAAYASVMRRLRDFAIYKTYGATGGMIMRLVLAEAVLTALVAGLIGFAAAAAVCLTLQHYAGSRIETVLFPVEWWLALVAELTALGACVLASLRPARIAAHSTPVEVFRIG